MLIDQETTCLETTVSVLKPIFNYIDALSGDKQVTISAV